MKPALDISFEFFPAKTEKAEAALRQTAQTLATVSPGFMSVTYGAGGSTQDRTLGVVKGLIESVSTPIAAHLTCVDATQPQVNHTASTFWDAGVRHIVALRGDPVGRKFEPHAEGYRNAAALVRGLLRVAPFDISVAAYPETHPEAASPQADLDNLKAKLDAGASRAITQFFFDADTFLRFRDRAVAAGITAEIVPGILPIGAVAQTYAFAEKCGAAVPDHVRAALDGLDERPETRSLVTTALAAELCWKLKEEDVSSFHFYTLNRAEPSYALCRLLQSRVQPRVQGPDRLTVA